MASIKKKERGTVLLYWYEEHFTDEVKKARDRALAKCANLISQKAKSLCPVDTGRLRASISWATKNQKSGVEAGAKAEDAVKAPDAWGYARIGSRVPYARIVEYVRKVNDPKPFLRPARDALAGQLPGVFKAEYQKAVEEMRRRP